VTVYLALDLVLKHAAGLGQLTHNDEDLAAVEELAHLGIKGNLLTEQEFVRGHLRYLGRPALLPVLRGFLARPGPPLDDVSEDFSPTFSPISIKARMAAAREGAANWPCRHSSMRSINCGGNRSSKRSDSIR
jgi:hypothetical protein